MIAIRHHLDALAAEPSLRAIARTLTAKGIATPAGSPKWTGLTVRRVLDRLARLDAER